MASSTSFQAVLAIGTMNAVLVSRLVRHVCYIVCVNVAAHLSLGHYWGMAKTNHVARGSFHIVDHSRF